MKRGRFSSAIIPALASLAVVLGLAAGTVTAAAGHAPARSYPAPGSRPVIGTAVNGQAASTRTVVFNCLKRAQVRPKSFMLACADGNDYLTGMTWTSWTPTHATATGKQMVNDCIPYCAAGKFHSYPAHVIFSRSEPVARHPGEKYFTRLTLLYPGARPPAYKNGKLVPGPDRSVISLWSSQLPPSAVQHGRSRDTEVA
ncbi:MAG TPA: hypothetical protein VE733_05025 [Streptosporangiaceae bacterium]|nr:hypothetical protein [Streptosporangiaceae bacterium]